MRRAAVGLALVLAGCGGVSEQALRDEQARARRYRDAYETQGEELKALRERLAALQAQGCAGPAAKGEKAAP